MSAYVHNLTILGGADFNQEYDMLETGGQPINLTGYTGKSQIRKHKNSGTAVSFNVGFLDRVNGKINISIPSWTTSKLKEGRYVYDILFTSPGGRKEIVLEGRINVRAGISTDCDFSKPTSAQRLCIAVIDENAGTQTFNGMYTKWEQFRDTYPNRTFYLLQPTPTGWGSPSNFGTGFGAKVDENTYLKLHCPDNFLNETTVNVEPLI
tara:strand:+ start:223 stop:846 length:624 start_codon:yes stop_codon:yes gene_type:complete